jgi:wobble nucleotide-excising tRNase
MSSGTNSPPAEVSKHWADNINWDYRGFYQIQREDRSIAEETLSEGEITFITFLYYLQLAKGGTSEENVTEERVLIIDDPISSLDSNVLFIVSTLIKEILKDVKLDKGNMVE